LRHAENNTIRFLAHTIIYFEAVPSILLLERIMSNLYFVDSCNYIRLAVVNERYSETLPAFIFSHSYICKNMTRKEIGQGMMSMMAARGVRGWGDNAAVAAPPY
jgi:hypothetical protein